MFLQIDKESEVILERT